MYRLWFLICFLPTLLQASPATPKRLYAVGFETEASYVYLRSAQEDARLYYSFPGPISEELCYWVRFEFIFTKLLPLFNQVESDPTKTKEAESAALAILNQFEDELQHIYPAERDALLRFLHFKTKRTAKELLTQYAPFFKRRLLFTLAWSNNINLSLKSTAQDEVIYAQWLTGGPIKESLLLKEYLRFNESYAEKLY